MPSAREKEIAQLVKEQRRDAQGLDRERIGRLRVVPLDARTMASNEAWNLATDEAGFAEVEDDLSDEPRPITHTEAQLAAVREAVAGLSLFEQEVYYCTFGQGLSERETAQEMRENDTKIHRTIVRVKERVAAALAALEDDAPGAEPS